MPGTSVLVLGGTGPAGICLIRELLHRGISTTVYARNPSKLPKEIASSRLIDVRIHCKHERGDDLLTKSGGEGGDERQAGPLHGHR